MEQKEPLVHPGWALMSNLLQCTYGLNYKMAILIWPSPKATLELTEMTAEVWM